MFEGTRLTSVLTVISTACAMLTISFGHNLTVPCGFRARARVKTVMRDEFVNNALPHL